MNYSQVGEQIAGRPQPKLKPCLRRCTIYRYHRPCTILTLLLKLIDKILAQDSAHEDGHIKLGRRIHHRCKFINLRVTGLTKWLEHLAGHKHPGTGTILLVMRLEASGCNVARENWTYKFSLSAYY
ncbi:hypothetical protein J6590_011604 [Homalodisca vitripennis]|nr:hypothetical protein J6590_011604 [Homalodisca vitripennis]